MESPESGRTAPLVQRVGTDASAAQVAESMVAIWQEIDLVLSPIIGPRGVAALYRRSLHLAAAAHPWIAVRTEGLQTEMDLTALKALIAQQSSSEAITGGMALLEAFRRLLRSLIGPALTERLLRQVWADSSSGSPAQDSQA